MGARKKSWFRSNWYLCIKIIFFVYANTRLAMTGDAIWTISSLAWAFLLSIDLESFLTKWKLRRKFP